MSKVIKRSGGPSISAAAAPGYDATAVLSTPDPDREFDTIELSALQALAGKRVVALVGHKPDEVCGTWENLRMDGGRLVGDLKLAANQYGRHVRSLIEANVPLGTSVKFRSMAKPNAHGGKHHTRLDLLEASIVAVPMNQDALFLERHRTTLETMEDQAGVRWAKMAEPNIPALKILTQANRALARSPS